MLLMVVSFVRVVRVSQAVKSSFGSGEIAKGLSGAQLKGAPLFRLVGGGGSNKVPTVGFDFRVHCPTQLQCPRIYRFHYASMVRGGAHKYHVVRENSSNSASLRV